MSQKLPEGVRDLFALTKYKIKRSAERGRWCALTADGACHMTFPFDATYEQFKLGVGHLLDSDLMMKQPDLLAAKFRDPQT